MKSTNAESSDIRGPFAADAQVENANPSRAFQKRESSSCPFAQDAYEPLPTIPLAAEADFYGEYSWCLNAYPTIREVVEHLSEELSKLERLPEWQRSEVITNIFLLACTITDTVDDYLSGTRYDFSKISRTISLAGPGIRGLERLFTFARGCRTASLFRLRRWRNAWAAAVTEFLAQSLVNRPEGSILLRQRDRLANLLPARWPKSLWKRRPRIPAFFRSRDFAPVDCLELGRKFLLAFPEPDRSVIVVGLRTAGSFLAPLLCAFLGNRLQGSQWVAVRPKQGLAAHERTQLREAARARARALIVDESIHSGQTLAQAVDMLRQSGFVDEDIVVLNPVEPAFPNWNDSCTFQSLPKVNLIALEPVERFKQQLLESETVERRLNEYFTARGYVRATVVDSPAMEELNSRWRTNAPERVDIRLKRVYKVHVTLPMGASEIRYVLAKSVGWGWLGYHAFLAGHHLAPFVPPVLGLRDGILYMEWLRDSHDPSAVAGFDRGTLIRSLASYVAARERHLRLHGDPAPDLAREGRLKGLAVLAGLLSRACNSRFVAALKRHRIQQELARQRGPQAVLTDSKMSREEWLMSGSKLLKVDYEHHGQGKNELGMTDPAFDLAGAIYHFGLSEAESAQLVHQFVNESGDTSVQQRLFMNKLLVGMWAQNLATLGLESPRLAHQRNESHRQYVSSWNFLVGETLKECGRLCQGPSEVRWRSPLVATDIDGVLDRMVFGFPSTTAAGIKAISLLHAHGFAIVANTARSLHEVKQYCQAYHFAGGVAEYGGVIWDAVKNRELALVSQEAQKELAAVRDALRRIPGVFLNDDYQYSLRAFTYQNGRTIPLPGLLIQDLLASMKLDRLHAHHTGLDTAILARETNKGVGLCSLLAFVGLPESEVLAIGDSEPDLSMFRVAGRSFAPGNVSCAREAQLLGSYIADAPYQPGLLQIVRKIVHPHGDTCVRCYAIEAHWPKDNSLFVSLLDLADEKPFSLLMRNLFDPSLLAVFRT